MDGVVKLGLGVAAVFVAVEGYKHFTGKTLEHELGTLRLGIVGVRLDQNEITIDVNIQNPNTKDITFKSFVGNMYADKKVIAVVKMFGTYVVRGNSEMKIPLIAMPKVLSLYRQVWKAYKNDHAAVQLVGEVNINDNTIPLTMSYTV